MAAQVCGALVSGAGVSAQIRGAAQARGGGTRRVLTPNQMEGGSHSDSWFCDQRAPWIEFFQRCRAVTFSTLCQAVSFSYLSSISF